MKKYFGASVHFQPGMITLNAHRNNIPHLDWDCLDAVENFLDSIPSFSHLLRTPVVCHVSFVSAVSVVVQFDKNSNGAKNTVTQKLGVSDLL